MIEHYQEKLFMKLGNLITLITNQYRGFVHTVVMPDRTRRVALIYDAKLPYDLNRNLLFDFKHGGDYTPIPPVRDIVKQFPSGAPSTV